MVFSAAKDYSKCIMLMTHALREFGQEKWTKLIHSVAEVGFRAACCEGDVAAYLSFLIVLLKIDIEPSGHVQQDRRHLLWSKFCAVLDSRMPFAEEGCHMNEENWENNLKESTTSYVEVHRNCIVEAKVSFLQESVRVSSVAQIGFTIR